MSIWDHHFKVPYWLGRAGVYCVFAAGLLFWVGVAQKSTSTLWVGMAVLVVGLLLANLAEDPD